MSNRKERKLRKKLRRDFIELPSKNWYLIMDEIEELLKEEEKRNGNN